MKLISEALKAHLSHPVTTLATCWRIVRMDGQMFAFTTFDSDIEIGGITYSSIAGFSRTAISTGSTGEVDNLNVVGFFQDDGITQQDIKNGLFDYASIYVFCLNWANVEQDVCRLRRGWLGECTLTPAGVFMAELRGLTQALVQEFGTDYMPICRADLGDNLCKVPIKPKLWTPSTTVNQGDYVQAATQTTDAMMVAIFQAFTVSTGAGTTGTVEPAWNPLIGSTTPDNDVYWNSQPYWRTIASVVSPINQHQFVSVPIYIPANSSGDLSLTTTAEIYFVDKVSAGTTIVVDDGVVSHAIVSTDDFGPTDAATYVYAYFSSLTGWGMTVTPDEVNGFYVVRFTNSSGQQGHIYKTGDTHDGVAIRDFQSLPFDGGHITWIDGQNAGRSMEIKTFDASTNTLTMWLGMYYPIAAGDRFFVYPGCDKRRDTCFTTFNNIVNFRGEPDMPMLDKVLSYPDV